MIDLIGNKYGKLTCLLIAGIVCIIPMFIIYKSIPHVIPEPIKDKKQILKYLLWVLGIVVLGIITNIILTHTSLPSTSEGFKRASDTLTDGQLIIKILCNCLVIPILEELLLRGIITGQLFLWYGLIPAILISSFCFGILHNNIVQLIYAMIIGIGLGIMYCHNKRLSLCIISHCLINLIVILFS